MTGSVCLPNFVVIGAPRSGTTSFFFYLKQHPDVFLPAQKELHYFSYELLRKNVNGPGDEDALASACADRGDYEAHYSTVRGEAAIGEVSPSYLYFSDVSTRIRSELGDVKIIALLRSPVEKAFSQYMHLVREDRETLSFYEALAREEERIRSGWSDIWRYARSSLYAEPVKAYLSVFGAINVKIILTKDLGSAPDAVMRDVFGFLGLDTTFRSDTSKVYLRSGHPKSRLVARFFAGSNPLKSIAKRLIPERIRIPVRLALRDANTGSKGQMDEKSEFYLRSYFREDIRELERVIGRETGWLEPPKR